MNLYFQILTLYYIFDVFCLPWKSRDGGQRCLGCTEETAKSTLCAATSCLVSRPVFPPRPPSLSESVPNTNQCFLKSATGPCWNGRLLWPVVASTVRGGRNYEGGRSKRHFWLLLFFKKQKLYPLKKKNNKLLAVTLWWTVKIPTSIILNTCTSFYSSKNFKRFFGVIKSSF